MSKIKQIVADIEELVEQGMSAKFISVSLGVPFEWAQQAIEQREALEIEKQYEYMSYADACADTDAQYYGDE
jgi:predicted CoA-binding protein